MSNQPNTTTIHNLSPVQIGALQVAHEHGKIYRSNALVDPAQQGASWLPCAHTNTIRSLQRRGLMEHKHFGIWGLTATGKEAAQ